MFTNAIVRTPGKSLIHGLTTANLGTPIYEKALEQHAAYIDALRACGLAVEILDADERFPDSTFVEDVALLTPECAILTNPGAPSRKGEVDGMKEVLTQYYDAIEEIVNPGTVEAGDIMMVGSHFYIGLSERTNELGAKQTIDILQKHGMTGATVSLEKVLHLKTGLAYLENNNLVVCGKFTTKREFEQFNKIDIPEHESYAANCIWVNGTVIVPAGHATARDKIASAGYQIIELDMSEFQKLDGGLSCLSLRF